MGVVFDDELLGDFFGNEEHRRIFAAKARLQGWLDTEAALAQVQAGLGIVPAAAADQITKMCDTSLYDFDQLRKNINRTQHPVVPVVHAVEALVGPESAQYVHFGATTQDIMDTGQSLQVRASLDALQRDLTASLQGLAALSQAHRDTPQAGRTHGQHAVPITFGLKVATWLDELLRLDARIAEARPRILAVQVFGAAGTSAAYGDKANDIRAGIARQLDLTDPGVPWHATRDRVVELGAIMGMLAGAAERIAAEVIRLQSTEFGELREPLQPGHVGSSTMPQKLNPHLSEGIVAKARMIYGIGATLMANAAHQHERDMGAWAVEWALVPEVMILAGATAADLRQLVEGLTVVPERMRANLDITGGQIVAENLMMRLDAAIGRDQAHELLIELARKSDALNTFRSVVANDRRVADNIPTAELQAILDPVNYVGQSGAVVDNIRSVSATRG